MTSMVRNLCSNISKSNMDIFVQVKSENNRIGFCSIFVERYMPLLKNVMRISALLCPHFGCSDSRSSPVRDCPAGRHMYLGCGYSPAQILWITSGALHRCNRCSAAFSLRPSIVSFRENLPVRASASAFKKGIDAYDFLIGFRREKEENPMNKKGEI